MIFSFDIISTKDYRTWIFDQYSHSSYIISTTDSRARSSMIFGQYSNSIDIISTSIAGPSSHWCSYSNGIVISGSIDIINTVIAVTLSDYCSSCSDIISTDFCDINSTAIKAWST